MRVYCFLLLTIACLDCFSSVAQTKAPPVGEKNVAYYWGQVALQCTGNDTERFRPRPTVTSRFLALIWTAVFDSWTRYDAKANPVYLTGVARRPADERSLQNKTTAISYAAYRSMLAYYYSDSLLLRKCMKDLALDPDNSSTDPADPAGIGNLAAAAVLLQRLRDGANQDGTATTNAGLPYADYTGYKPVNTADTLNDLRHWQPKYFSDANGKPFLPECLTPQWGHVQPLLLASASQFRPPPPPAIGSAELIKEIKEVVALQAALTNEQKGLVEFMRDGPKSVQQAGHWFIFAQEVSRRDKHTLDDDVKMYFLVQAVAMDAFIACWDAKMFYDFARPYSLVHDYYKDQVIRLWGGPGAGFIDTTGRQWRPYSPDSFLCPPFPSYVSGHSTVSAACAEALRLFTGSDAFGASATVVPGALTEPAHAGAPVTLHFRGFTETAEMAGFSRVLGGYHIQADNKEGLILGRKVAAAAWEKYRQYTGDKTLIRTQNNLANASK
ncbi:MAG TPA: vanadium-dependent haloperoxidase [Chitinophagaceae bacterium]|nr:vanadium-dependent haloperoxidase [Chitinophagaceae bacterium]